MPRVIEIDGLRSVIVHDRGNGDATVVLMPSMLIAARSYRRLVQRLSQSFRVIAIDPPGSGRASRVPNPWTFEDYARRLLRTLDFLDLADVTLIGHSNSAAAAILAAAMQGRHGRIAQIVLADSVGADPRHGFWRIGLGRLLDGVFETGFSITALYDVFWNLIVHRRNFLAQIDQAINWDAGPHAPRVRVPTLIAWGGNDLTFLPWCGRRLGAMIPRSQFHVLPPGHHDWPETHPAEFAAAVEAFCRKTVAYPPETIGSDPGGLATQAAPARISSDNDPCGLYSER